jgi:hypothetical protein
VDISSGCKPEKEIEIGGVVGNWCEEQFDLEGGTAFVGPSGDYKQLVLVLPLSANVSSGKPEQSLLAVAGTSSSLFASKEQGLWAILQSLLVGDQ